MRKSEYIEESVLTHLYYSMGINRMVYYDYERLIVPQLKEFISETLKSFETKPEGDLPKRTINFIVNEAKEQFQLFGHRD